MDGRKLQANPERTWMGYSVGRWYGDTLVVDSFGFNDRTWLDARRLPHTEALREFQPDTEMVEGVCDDGTLVANGVNEEKVGLIPLERHVSGDWRYVRQPER